MGELIYVRGDKGSTELCVVEDDECKVYPLTSAKVIAIIKKLAECM